jgi:hypothetical protein
MKMQNTSYRITKETVQEHSRIQQEQHLWNKLVQDRKDTLGLDIMSSRHSLVCMAIQNIIKL